MRCSFCLAFYLDRFLINACVHLALTMLTRLAFHNRLLDTRPLAPMKTAKSLAESPPALGQCAARSRKMKAGMPFHPMGSVTRSCLSATILVWAVTSSMGSNAYSQSLSAMSWAEALPGAKAGWKELRHLAESAKVQAEVSHEFWSNPKAKNSAPSTYLVRFNGLSGNFVYEYSSMSADDYYAFAAGYNPDYAFSLSASLPDKYQVKSIDKTNESVRRNLEIRNELYTAIMAGRAPIDWLVDCPGFTPKSTNRSVEDGMEVFTVVFEIPDFCQYERDVKILSGSISLLPEYHWAIKRFSIDASFYDGMATLVGNATYDSESISHGLPRTHRLETQPVDGKSFRSRETRYASIGPGDAKKNACTLSAFGLLEPAGFDIEASRSRLVYIWLNVGIVVMLMLGIYLNRRARLMQ